jgi:alpha-tubulin suppressor-like RCC1 family protein
LCHRTIIGEHKGWSMAGTAIRRKFVAAAAILLAAALAITILVLARDSSEKGPLKLPVGKGVPAIALGERHGLILASDGSLWTWGSDFLGWPVLGLGNTMKSTRLRRIGDGTNWVGISTGMSRSIGVKSDGTTWAWGESAPPRNAAPVPIPSPIPAAPGNDWKQAVAGGNHFVALKKDGTLWAWGNNWSGALGIASINGSPSPVQVGSSTNWTRVWAGILETVGRQADGSLWYWGENPDPAFGQGVNQIFAPTRISPDNNWTDVGFGVNTVFAIKADGTLWVWGRHAHVYTGVTNQSLDANPMQIGTNTDWRAFSACTGWWIQGLTKTDGSLWEMDASEGKPNGPGAPAGPVQFRQIEFRKEYAAAAVGAVHAAAAGIHEPIGVVLTPDGEVWTWGLVMGDPPCFKDSLQEAAAKIGRVFRLKIPPPEASPILREKPWQLRNSRPNDSP